MALTSERTPQQANGSMAAHDACADTEFPTPDLGRSVCIVDKVVNVDMKQSPHPKNQRGELGKPLFTSRPRNSCHRHASPGCVVSSSRTMGASCPSMAL
jgi:hypothetical protein